MNRRNPLADWTGVVFERSAACGCVKEGVVPEKRSAVCGSVNPNGVPAERSSAVGPA